jgi:hypothetical protein
MRAMDDQRYVELLNAIVDLRNATELGFANVDRRFDEMEQRWDRRFGALETRFDTLEHRVEDGFRGVNASLDAIHSRLAAVEQH